MKLFVCGFSESTTLSDLAALFEDYGPIVAARMRQGEKRKYALVEMYDGAAESAIEQMDGQEWRGNQLTVQESKW